MQKKYSVNELMNLLTGSDKILVDLGCGTRKKNGYIGVDGANLTNVDIICNLEEGLPFDDNSIDGIYSNFLFEHIPNTVFLFKELYRVCKNDAIIEFRVPSYQSVTQYKDPAHSAIITAETTRYFSEENWYGSDYNINTNFKMLKVEYSYLKPFNYFVSKKIFFLWPITYPLAIFARRFFWNVLHSIVIHLKVFK